MISASSIKAVLFDMDGVLFVGDRVIPGAIETLARLHQHNIPFRFVTNTTTRTPTALTRKLRLLGFAAAEQEMFSAVTATVEYLAMQGTPSVFLAVHEAVKACFEKFPSNPRPDYVVIGDIGEAWDYALLNKIFNLLMGGAKLVCMHRNKFWQEEDGLRMDIGAFVAALESVTCAVPIVIGKPSPRLFNLALRSMQVGAGQAILVGDDIESDVGGAQGAGIAGVLVKTGKYREELVAGSKITPDAVINSVVDLNKLLGYKY
ncbi:TIGR01458 family HAD-type hydrolase [Teredinibacter waterburyi]|uniref:TIGR01458 family HAD-type hydrolase n=1 Tax=Teredinibacter waterburyi TaxID=1500538 RepID=UPI001660002D|nr:TIGR01458 family HAD-type hydrolase [Teredinibacter waterburyi]